MSFDKQNFKTNPNFKFRESPADLRECLGTTYTYDVYKDKQGRVILITPYWNINEQCNKEGDPSVGLEKYHYISLIDLSNNEEIQTLVGHTDRVVTCRFFEDPFTGKQYLISADRKYKVKVWDLTDNGKIVFDKELKEGYDNFIYSVLMIFEQNKIYVVTSTLGSGETNVFVIGSDEAPKKLKDTKDLNIYYLDYWFEEKDADGNSEHHIIQCGKNKILISQLKKDSNYEIATEEKYANNLCGMVYKKGDKDLLITSATRGLIEIIDLKERKELQKIEHSDVFFYNFVKYTDHSIL